jgi:hypothetical protein
VSSLFHGKNRKNERFVPAAGRSSWINCKVVMEISGNAGAYVPSASSTSTAEL